VLAFLVERGIFGFLGITLFFCALAKMLFQAIKTENSKQESLWIIGLFGMFVFTLSFSMSHEVLHFRHVWCAFALIAVEYKLWIQNKEKKQLSSDKL
jgi:O-antigen ligase